MTTKNLDELTRDELKATATQAGIEFANNITNKKLIEKLKEAGVETVEVEDEEDEEEKIDADADNGDDGDEGDAPAPVNSVYYYFGNATCIDDDPQDSSKILPAGLYRFPAPIKRFAVNGVPFGVTYFGEQIPNGQIIKLAERFQISMPSDEDVDFDAVLETMLSENPFN